MSMLRQIKNPQDVKNLTKEQLPELFQELRNCIVNVTDGNGGHLASSLGAVELTVALLRQFDFQQDRIIFDVGHQAYPWKILTGRYDRFSSLRQKGGLSGFPKIDESPYDHFNTGHSSTSLSAALGYAVARDLQKKDHHVLAVVGDGAIINGESFEALNHAGELGTKVICILNDNGISISPRVGGMGKHLAKLTTSSFYLSTKHGVKKFCQNMPGGEGLGDFLKKSKNRIKRYLSPNNLFQTLGWTYWGPFDGHDESLLEDIFAAAKNYEKPLVIHVTTQKGRGHAQAELEPIKYHGVSPSSSNGKPKKLSWSEAVADVVLDWAKEDETVLALTPAMGEGSKLGKFQQTFPERYFDGGIAEEHMMTFASALALAQQKPVLFIYSTFLQRAVDQLVHDAVLQQVDLTVAIDRAGFVGEDGETHQGLYDLAWLQSLPKLTFWSFADQKSLTQLPTLRQQVRGPLAFRFPRGSIDQDLLGDWRGEGGWNVQPVDSDLGILAIGNEVALALEVSELAKKQGVQQPVIACLEQIKPLPTQKILDFCSKLKRVVVVECGVRLGGVGEKICALCHQHGLNTKVLSVAINDTFILHATQQEQRNEQGFTAQHILSLLTHEEI